MNREIKFRGICIQSKELVYGDLIHGVGWKKGNVYILPDNENLAYVKHCDPLDGVRVIPETVGQFTGLRDKNGKEIYEGDKVTDESTVDDSGTGFEGAVEFVNGSFIINSLNCGCDECENSTHWPLYGGSVRVIGNIFDNPEYLQL